MLTFELCDYTNPNHLNNLADLLQEYMADPMGGHSAHSKLQQLRLVDGLANHPKSFVVFAIVEDKIVGMATCFELFSTFEVKPFVNIHDLIVSKQYRGKGYGKAILNEVARIAEEKKCCKVSLEVRTDNTLAQGLYRSLGFSEAEPDMLFWIKKL